MSSQRGFRLGPGPVFVFEWITASRRRENYLLRSLFVTFFLAALVVVWLSRPEVQSATLRTLASVGEEFFVALIGTQLTLVLLAAPAATAGAICLDRARGTLQHLLLTDLSSTEIVLGKLAARLVPVLFMVGCALPVMALLTFLGGIDLEALLQATVVTVGVAVLGCSLALVISLWAVKAHEALLGTYAVWGLWLLGVPMLNQLNGALGSSLPVPPPIADPYLLAFAPYWRPGSVGWVEFLEFLGATGGLSALLATLAVLRLRAVCTRETVRRRRAGGWFLGFGSGPAKRARWLVVTLRLPGPSLDGNPVLWREWHRSRPSRWGRIVAFVFVGLATVFSIEAVLFGPSRGGPPWVNGLQASIGLLLLSIPAATALAEERVRGSLDLLMATPLSTREIVLGKWLGSIRLVPLLTILPGLVILAAPTQIGERWAALALTVAFILSCGAAVTALGLALATWISRLGRALAVTITLYVLVTVGWIFVVMMLWQGPRREQGLMMASPFFWVGMMTAIQYDSPPRELEIYPWSIFWIVFYVFTAAGLLAATLATFNRCLGRVEHGRGSLGIVKDDPQADPLS
jgi:ABC-type transport system involved in multi-copper enzyme maturation permease subunit